MRVASVCATVLLHVAAQVVAQRPLGNNNWNAIETDDFIRVKGTRFVDKSGSEYFMLGFNYYHCMNLGAEAEAGGNYTRLITEMDQMAARGINHLRIMASSEGASTIQPFRMYPALMPSPNEWNEQIFVGLDRCVAEAGKRGIRLTMTLNDEWHWSGGMAQYVSWVNKNQTIPYPPSWDPTANPKPWGAFTNNGTYSFEGYANQFYGNKEAQTIFQSHIYKVLYRVNTVNGRYYYQDATIMAWELANEPQLDAHLIEWASHTSGLIKGIASRQLVTTGSESKFGRAAFRALHTLPTIDYATAHLWVQNWGAYQMMDESAANLNNAIGYAKRFIGDISQWAKEIGKPVVLEEFGFPRDNWLNQKQKLYTYGSTASTKNKDTFFDVVLSEVVSYWVRNLAFAGFMPWTYGGIWRPEALFRNQFNEAWAGDPPHEPPGWYDVYDRDETMNVIEKWTINVNAIIAMHRR